MDDDTPEGSRGSLVDRVEGLEALVTGLRREAGKKIGHPEPQTG